MVLRIGTSSARAAPTSTPPTSLTHQEVACLKTALALVVVKRRLLATTTSARRRPSPLPDQDNDDGNNTTGMEFELETNDNSSSMTNPLSPWMPLLGSQLTTATAGIGATSSTSTAWMNHNPSSRTTKSNGNGSNRNSAADWVHINHFLALALQRAAFTFEATQQQNNNRNRSQHNHNDNHNDSLTALTTHLAYQLVRMNKNNTNRNNSSSTTVGADALSDWIRSTFLHDIHSPTQSSDTSQSSSLHSQNVCIVWHGMLTAQPVELPGFLLPVLVPFLQQALDESTSSSSSSSSSPPSSTPSPPSATTNDSDHALYLQLFEHALHHAPTMTVEAVLEEMALTSAQYCWPVSLADLAANYEWKRRRHSTANKSATYTHAHTHTMAGGALLLRYGMSSILQQTMLSHHHPHGTGEEHNKNKKNARGIRGSREI